MTLQANSKKFNMIEKIVSKLKQHNHTGKVFKSVTLIIGFEITVFILGSKNSRKRRAKKRKTNLQRILL